jgi:threonine dehydratase
MSFTIAKSVAFDLQTAVRMVCEAQHRIAGFVAETPAVLIAGEPERFGNAQVYLKLENLQKTGSFKLRGASNRIVSLSAEEAARGVVTSSTGNHGLGVAAAARHRGIDAEIFISTQVAPEKYRKMQDYGARIRHVGENPLEAELAARAAASDSGRTYVPPYNDALVVAGQGTIALELTSQIRSMDAVYVAVGGGGLISGIGAYLAAVSPKTQVVGCWPENSRVLYESLNAGRIIEFAEMPTLSESTAGGVEPGSITFELCQKVVRRHVLVSESEILDAMRWGRAHSWTFEGAAGVALAAFFKDSRASEGKAVAIICCGGNLSPKVEAALA